MLSSPFSRESVIWSPYDLWHAPSGSGIVDTGLAMYSLSHGGKPLGIFLNPSMSSEYATRSDAYPKFRKANDTPYDLTASAMLPICGIPEAPRPLSTFINFRDLPKFLSRFIIESAILSSQVPLPIVSISGPGKSHHKFLVM